MEIAEVDLAGDIAKVILDGRFDIAGAAAVDLKMNAIAGSRKSILIDLQKVTFLGSMGLRTMVCVIRTVKGRGGKMALYGPSEEVEKVLAMSGVGSLVSIYHEMQTALAYLQ